MLQDDFFRWLDFRDLRAAQKNCFYSQISRRRQVERGAKLVLAKGQQLRAQLHRIDLTIQGAFAAG